MFVPNAKNIRLGMTSALACGSATQAQNTDTSERFFVLNDRGDIVGFFRDDTNVNGFVNFAPGREQ